MAAHQFTPTMTTVFVRNEVPNGTAQNGINATFSLVNVPMAGSLDLYWNGVRCVQDVDFTISGKTITFTAGTEPGVLDTLIANYNF